jgi:hypothetical protein
MRIGLGQRGRDMAAPGGVDHRAGDVASSTEHHVGSAALEDPSARGRCTGSEEQRTRHGRAGLRVMPETLNVSSS